MTTAPLLQRTNWVPGDPLHTPAPHSNYFFNFRDESWADDCRCADAASWPVPDFAHDLDPDPTVALELAIAAGGLR